MAKSLILLFLLGLLSFGTVSQGFSEEMLNKGNSENYIIGDQEKPLDWLSGNVIIVAAACRSYHNEQNCTDNSCCWNSTNSQCNNCQ
jgi:hypothetical protein